jgi:soluble lytic murein transglycosylase-like protein
MPEAPAKSAAPRLLVKSMLGFRAFKGEKGPDAADAPPPATQPAAGPKPLLGLSKPVAKAADPATFRPSVRPPDKPRTDRSGSGRARRRGQDPIPRWFFAVAGAAGVLVLGIVVVVIASRARRPEPLSAAPEAPRTQSDAARPGSSPTVAPTASASAPTAPLKESDELRALLEEQGRRIAACKRDPSACNKWSREAEAPLAPAALARHGSMPGWLKRVTLPRGFPDDFPDDDDVALKQVFDWDSKNRVGRKEFSTRYFRCGEYAEIFAEALLKYDAPPWLRAVAYQESGCILDAESGVHARGLWQFMAESARAYGLKVSEGEIDERLDPVKATDAAIHFLSDLQQALGSWDLALAGYNMGPWGVFTRVKQLGGKATFWDLYQGRLLPEETAGYVPAIEAFALILDNLVPLKLAGLPAKRPWANEEITDLPDGTRLSLIARAARTSASEIKAMNRAYLKGVLPKGETTAWVPQSGAQLATEFFKNPLPEDGLDVCVPEDFNWGASQLPDKYAQGCPKR